MKNIENLFTEAVDSEHFARGYLNYISYLLGRLDTRSIASFIKELEIAHRNQNTIFIAGNGGSAATATHMANDIGMDILKKSGIEQPFRAFSLTDNVALMTAIANDNGYHNLFVNQLKIYYRSGDLLIAISASGNSPNIIAAAEWVKQRAGKVLGLVGFDGGKLKDICDVAIHVETPEGEFGPVEDIHLIMDHLIANWLQYIMKNEKAAS